jgi:nitric oxide reductase NorQ protein
MTQQDLQAAYDRRIGGESWEAIGKSLGMPESTLRGRLRNAGFNIGNRGIRAARTKKAKVAATTTTPTTTPAAVATTPGFVEPSWYPSLRYAVSHERGATLFGPRGCGKSTAIRALATELSAKTVTLQCAANMQIDSLLGTWTSQAGTLSFVDGPLTIAVRTGSWLLAEEANVIHPGVWSLVNTLTDTTGEGLRLPTGELIAQSADFRLVLIFNEGYSGTREVNAALKDRLMPIYAGYLPAAEESQLLVTITGATTDEADRVVSVGNMIRAANLRFDLSPRSLVRWIKLVKLAAMSWRDAYDRAILDLVGTPELAGPQRTCLTEIARNSVDQWS